MPEIIHAYKNKLDKRRRINHRLNFCATGKGYTPFFAKPISASRCLGNALVGGKKDFQPDLLSMTIPTYLQHVIYCLLYHTVLPTI